MHSSDQVPVRARCLEKLATADVGRFSRAVGAIKKSAVCAGFDWTTEVETRSAHFSPRHLWRGTNMKRKLRVPNPLMVGTMAGWDS